MSPEFESLERALEGHFDKKFAELPDDLKRILPKPLPMFWDKISAEQKRRLAWQSDWQSDPLLAPRRQRLFDLFFQADKIERRLKNIENAEPITAIECEATDSLRDRYLKQLDNIRVEVRNLAASPPPATTKRDRFADARDLAREIAEERWGDKSDKIILIGKMAAEIQGTIAADTAALGLEPAPTVDTIKGWIKDLAPEGARKGGRPQKPRAEEET